MPNKNTGLVKYNDGSNTPILPEAIELDGIPYYDEPGSKDLSPKEAEQLAMEGAKDRVIVKLFCEAATRHKPRREGESIYDDRAKHTRVSYRNVKHHEQNRWSGSVSISSYTFDSDYDDEWTREPKTVPCVEFIVHEGNVTNIIIKWAHKYSYERDDILDLKYFAKYGRWQERRESIFEHLLNTLNSVFPNVNKLRGYRGIEFKLDKTLENIVAIKYMGRKANEVIDMNSITELLHNIWWDDKETSGMLVANNSGDFVIEPQIDKDHVVTLSTVEFSQNELFIALADALQATLRTKNIE